MQVGTDEVYGTLPEDDPATKFHEEMPLLPNSPYSATKAAADCLVRAAFHTLQDAGDDDALLEQLWAVSFPGESHSLYLSRT